MRRETPERVNRRDWRLRCSKSEEREMRGSDSNSSSESRSELLPLSSASAIATFRFLPFRFEDGLLLRRTPPVATSSSGSIVPSRLGSLAQQWFQHRALIEATSQYRPQAQPTLEISPVVITFRAQLPSSRSAHGEIETRPRESTV